MADNYFMNNEDKIEDVWKTPRESWHTTCDGYIDTKDINDALKKVDGYSKILKTRKYDKIVTENGACPNERSPVSFKSQVVVSYNNSKVKFQRICIYQKSCQTGSKMRKSFILKIVFSNCSSLNSSVSQIFRILLKQDFQFLR